LSRYCGVEFHRRRIETVAETMKQQASGRMPIVSPSPSTPESSKS
jgi:hypothetical protein